MFCSHCGKETKDNAKYCAHCGTSLETGERTARVAADKKNAEEYSAINELTNFIKWKITVPTLFKGRLNRKSWLFGVITSFVAFAIALIAVNIIGAVLSTMQFDSSVLTWLLSTYVYAFYVIYLFSVHARRFHDLGQSAWLSLLLLIPIINLITLVCLCSLRGQKVDNQYGKKPFEDEMSVLAIVAIALVIVVTFIAIVGILSSLVLVALGSARNKAQDARINSDVAQLRTLAEVYYDANNNSYYGFSNCVLSPSVSGCGGDAAGVSNISTLTSDITEAGGNLLVNSNVTEFCISSSLKTDSTQNTCMDSSGKTNSGITASCGSYATSCPN